MCSKSSMNNVSQIEKNPKVKRKYSSFKIFHLLLDHHH